MSNQNNIEAKIKRLDEILARIEDGGFPIEEVVEEYKKANELVCEIEQNLSDLKNEIEVISRDFSKE